MKSRLFVFLFAVSPCLFAVGQDTDWLPRFLDQLDPASAVVAEIEQLGPDASRDEIIATAANYFRSRDPLIPMWEVPLEAVATAEDIAKADLAIDHVITERSGVYTLPEKLPWFDAPKTFYTLSRFPHFDYLTRAYNTTRDERYAAAMVRDFLDFVTNVPLAKAENFHVQVAGIYNPWNWVILQVRLRRWNDALAHLRASPSLSDENYLRIAQYMWDEVDWVVPRKILGLHNGTLGNASSILYLSLQYPEAKSAAFWQSDATS
ncbi:MAG: heparinase II/III family protein, partial [Verrucomicrobiia bacterium]